MIAGKEEGKGKPMEVTYTKELGAYVRMVIGHRYCLVNCYVLANLMAKRKNAFWRLLTDDDAC